MSNIYVSDPRDKDESKMSLQEKREIWRQHLENEAERIVQEMAEAKAIDIRPDRNVNYRKNIAMDIWGKSVLEKWVDLQRVADESESKATKMQNSIEVQKNEHFKEVGDWETEKADLLDEREQAQKALANERGEHKKEIHKLREEVDGKEDYIKYIETQMEDVQEKLPKAERERDEALARAEQAKRFLDEHADNLNDEIGRLNIKNKQLEAQIQAMVEATKVRDAELELKERQDLAKIEKYEENMKSQADQIKVLKEQHDKLERNLSEQTPTELRTPTSALGFNVANELKAAEELETPEQFRWQRMKLKEVLQDLQKKMQDAGIADDEPDSEEEVKSLKEQVETLTKNSESSIPRTEHETKLKEQEEATKKAQEDLVALKSQHEVKLNDLQSQLDGLISENTGNEENLKKLGDEKTDLENQLQACLDSKGSAAEEAAKHQQALSDLEKKQSTELEAIKMNLDEREADLAKLRAEIERLKAKAESESDRTKEAEKQKDTLRKDLNEARDENRNMKKQNFENLRDQKKKTEEQDKEIAKYKNEGENYQKQVQRVQAQLANVNAKLNDAGRDIQKLRTDNQNLLREKAKLERSEISLKAQVSANGQELGELKRKMTDISNRHDMGVQASLPPPSQQDPKEEDIGQPKKTVEELEGHNKELESKLRAAETECQVKIDRLTKALQEAERKNDKCDETVAELRRQIEALKKELEEAKKEAEASKRQLETAKLKLKDIEKKLEARAAPKKASEDSRKNEAPDDDDDPAGAPGDNGGAGADADELVRLRNEVQRLEEENREQAEIQQQMARIMQDNHRDMEEQMRLQEELLAEEEDMVPQETYDLLQDVAREQVALHKREIEQLTVEKDLLEDLLESQEESRLIQIAELREQLAAAGAPAGAPPPPAADADAAAAAHINASDRLRNLLRGARNLTWAQTQNGAQRAWRQARQFNIHEWVDSADTSMNWLGFFTIICACMINIASGREYALWKNANATSRSMFLATSDKKMFCLKAPQFEFFWEFLIVFLSGGYSFRLSRQS